MMQTAEDIYEESTEARLINTLKQRVMKITAAESLTGGLIAAALISVPGASAVLDQTVVVYANEAKENILGVRPETLREHGAVSEETAREMAAGAARWADCEISVCSTGIAGPDGGSAAKPVGLVWLSCSCRGKITTKKFHFSGNREEIRRQASEEAVKLAWECLEKADNL